MKSLVLAASLAAMLCAQDTPKPTKPEAPKLTVELARDFWKARTRQISAAKEKDDADAQMQAVVKKMQDFCGNAAILSGDAQGDPSCQLKQPEPDKPAAK